MPHNVTVAGARNILTAAPNCPRGWREGGGGRWEGANINVKHLAEERLQPWEGTRAQRADVFVSAAFVCFLHIGSAGTWASVLFAANTRSSAPLRRF